MVLSRNYPNAVMPELAPWVERPTIRIGRQASVKVVSPVPWCPPLPDRGRFEEFTRFRRVPRREIRHGLEVHHPRFVIPPGNRLHVLDATGYLLGVRGEVRRLRRWFPFDLIHAHFTYPDGVVAARLGAEHGVPVVVSEHAPWKPWLDEHPLVRRQAVRAAHRIDRLLPVSRAVRETIVSFTDNPERVTVVPPGVDQTVFGARAAEERDLDKILFVGMVRPTKGLDVLLDAMPTIVASRPDAHLVVVGGTLFRSQRPHMAQLQELATHPPLRGHVTFTGALPTPQVAEHMATSAVLVVPSRLESFGAVLVEALACGTPVVATRSGGPEDIVTPDVGRLVPPEDPDELATAVLDVLENPDRYPVERLRAHVTSNFSWDAIADRLVGIYREVLR